MKLNNLLFIFSMITILSLGCSKKSESQLFVGNTPIDTNTVVSGIATPWEILWGPDNYIWFTERAGKVNRLNPATGSNQLILTIEDAFEYGEAGLLGMALHPDFEQTPWVYLVYNYTDGPLIKERLVRYYWNGSQLVDPVTLINGIPGNSYHNGSRLVFGGDGKLYMSTGDAGTTSNSQNMNSLAGKILRINPDGSIPEDNPFPGKYIWALGLRNSQGMVFGPQGYLYASEHGPNSDDEFNFLETGRNYGWPTVNGFCNTPEEITFCQANNVREPLYTWTPTLAVAGIDYYGSNAIPEWNGTVLMTTLKASRLVALKLGADEQSVEEVTNFFDGTWGRLRDICISPDGAVYVAVSNRDGRGTPRPGDDRIVEIKAKNTTGFNRPGQRIPAFNIVPNPVKDEVLVTGNLLGEQYQYIILDSLGQIAQEGVATGKEFRIRLNSLKSGYYFMRISNQNNSFTEPFVVL